MTVIVFVEVISRYVFNYTPSWSEEVTILLMTWMAFLGMALGIKSNTHLQISFLVDRMPGAVKKVFLCFDEIVVVAFGVVLLVFGVMICRESTGSVMSSTGLPEYTAYLMVPCTGVLVVIYSCIRAVNVFLTKGAEEKVESGQ